MEDPVKAPGKTPPRTRGVFNRLFVVPFGRFRRHSSTIENSVFVGREGQLAYLIDALTSNARRGAYLVTGRRGVGKSTFVETCVRQANHLKYRRFMRRTPGRTIIDQSLVLLILFASLAFLTVDSELLREISTNGSPLAIAIGTLILILPALALTLYALFCLRAAIISIGYINIRHYVTSILLFFGILFLISRLIHPMILIGVIVGSIFVLYILGNSLNAVLVMARHYLIRSSAARLISTLLLVSIALFFSLVLFTLASFTIGNLSDSVSVTENEYASVSGFLVFISTYFTLQFIALKHVYERRAKSPGIYIYLSAYVFAVVINYCALLVFLRISGYTEAGSSLQSVIHLAAISIEATLFVYIATAACLNEKAILAKNAVGCEESSGHDKQNENVLYRPVESLVILKILLLGVIFVQIINSAFPFTKLTKSSLTGVNEELTWVVAAGIGVIACFLVEFVWITRGLSRLRFPAPLSSFPLVKDVVTHHYDRVWADISSLKGREKKFNNSYIEKMCTFLFERSEPVITRVESVNRLRLLNDSTFSSLLIKYWTPSLVVRINLGFDSLDHRSVIHAMLHGLRDEYHRRFLSLYSVYSIISKFCCWVLLVVLVGLLSRVFFDFPEIHQSKRLDNEMAMIMDNHEMVPACETLLKFHELANLNELGKPPSLLYFCNHNAGLGSSLLPFLYFSIIDLNPDSKATGKTNETSKSDSYAIIDKLLHYHYDLPKKYDSGIENQGSYSFRVFHLLIFIVLYWLSSGLFKYLSLYPYNRNLEKIQSLADSLVNTELRTTSKGKWSIGRIVTSLTSQEAELANTRDPLDSRSVELAFMTLLNDICNAEIIGYPRILSFHAPSPDLIFIFDELDKISGLPVLDKDISTIQIDMLENEARRSAALHALLSDMKRLIGSAPARFIFVGNRSLYDEHVADEGKREPLLSTIFDANVYLPSLLLDNSQFDSVYSGMSALRINEAGLSTGNSEIDYQGMRRYVKQYFDDLYVSAGNYRNTQQEKWNSAFHLISGSTSYGRKDAVTLHDLQPNITIVEWNYPTKEDLVDKTGISPEKADLVISVNRYITSCFLYEFIGFLSFRSKGIPKKLGDIIAEYVRPTQRIHAKEEFYFPEHEFRRLELDNDMDCLSFSHRSIYRIQLINSLFRQVETSFETQLLDRDDKVTIDVLYLFDFLMKFHGRAFSWSNLEHVDELAHIHKTPDLRNTISEILEAGVGRFLHPVLNGLYSFRFRTEFAAEIRYLSKINEAESAAFNFTQEESQSLKTTYKKLIESSTQPNEDLMVALGELHEYDQDYELARGWYYSALFLNDREFGQYVGESVDLEDSLRAHVEDLARDIHKTSRSSGNNSSSFDSLKIAAGITTPPERVPFVKAITLNNEDALNNLAVHLPWATRRIRLLLQIGLTYEQTYDLERAQSYYLTAHGLSRAITLYIHRAFDDLKQNEDTTWFSIACDHLPVLYQPAFAAAWISEKSVGSINSSTDIVELELLGLEQRFPKNLDKERVPGHLKKYPYMKTLLANFSMIKAETHNKAGDLYFFKGYAGTEQQKHVVNRNLRLAAYHYSVALVMVRHYCAKFDLVFQPTNTISTGLPFFINQLIYSNVVDIAETIFSCSSISDLVIEFYGSKSVSQLEVLPNDIGELVVAASHELSCYLSGSDSNLDNCNFKDENIRPFMNAISIQKILEYGDSESINNRDHYNSNFSGGSNLIATAITLSLLGSQIAERAGLTRAAIDEYVTSLEMIERTLKWIAIRLVKTDSGYWFSDGENLADFLIFLLKCSQYSLLRAEHLYLRNSDTYPGGSGASISSTPDERNFADAATQGCGILLMSSLLWEKFVQYPENADTDLQSKFEEVSGDIKCIMTKWFDFDAKINNRHEVPNNTSSVRTGYDTLSGYDYDSHDPNSTDEENSSIAYSLRDFTRSRLIYLNDRYSFPFLACLQRLKMLADEVYLREIINRLFLIQSENPGSFRVNRHAYAENLENQLKEATRWTEDYLYGAEQFDNSSLCTPLELAETCYLRNNATLNTEVKPYSSFNNQGLKSYQTISMGNAYYVGLRKMIYLFDDFNDRKVHFRHSCQMAGRCTIEQICSNQ